MSNQNKKEGTVNLQEYSNLSIEKAKKYAFDMHDQPSESQRYGNAPYSVHLQAVVDNGQKYLYYIPENDREDVIMACHFRKAL